MLGTDGGGGGGRSLRQRDRAAAEAKIFNEGKGASAARIVYPQYRYGGDGGWNYRKLPPNQLKESSFVPSAVNYAVYIL